MHFGKQTLISGKNGAGKSTIIDALQVLFVADQRQIRFNPAAHDEAKRTLIDYFKGKIGSDERSYLRDGDFNTYIIAEFWDEEKQQPFVVGMVADVYRDLQHDEEYFIIAPMKLDDLQLVKPDGRLRNCDEFRRYYSGSRSRIRTVFERNKSQYQKALLNRMGQVHERFFTTFVKALSFKPIQNIREFVYQYILDRRELQLDLMKQNFEIHERYQLELEELQRRQEKLSAIRVKYSEVDRLRKTVKEQDYVVRRLKAQEKSETVNQTQQILTQLEQRIEQLDQDIAWAVEKKAEAERKSEETLRMLYENAEEQRRKELEKDIQHLKEEKERLTGQLHAWISQLRRESETLAQLSEWPGNQAWVWPEEQREHLARTAERLSDLAGQTEREQDLVAPEAFLRKTGEQLSVLHDKMSGQRTRMEDRQEELKQSIAELKQTIADLENKKRPYRPELLKLKELLQERLGSRSDVWIFCEEMEVIDETWRNAIEGYLNTQRFDVLVEPDVFREALRIYEQEKMAHGIEGVGLVNTDKERQYLGTARPGALSEALETCNPVIQAHLEHLLGRVMKARDEQDLLRYRTAVTASCMVYNRLVARQMPSQRYAVPYIGQKAIEKQLELKREELRESESAYQQLERDLRELGMWIRRLQEKRSHYERLAEHLDLPQQLRSCRERLRETEEQLAGLDLSEADRLRELASEWGRKKREWEEKHIELVEERGIRQKDRDHRLAELQIQLRKQEEADGAVEEWKQLYGAELLPGALERWKDAERNSSATAHKIQNWENSRKGNLTTLDRTTEELRNLRMEYNTVYAFNGNTHADTNNEYDELLDQIANVNIPDFQKKVETALKESEEEFKSHFVFKLREAIEMARREFRELNYALDHFPFSTDKYHFEVRASEKYKRFYDAVMDPMLMERGSLFDTLGDDRLEVLHELFETLVRGEAGEMDEFTDYRRYLDFDIIVTSGESRYRFSQVLKEKSGGETQTPFYVAILASFHHLYSSQKTVRLVVFDEAFNKMDEQRIQASLRLIKRMDLQLIAAVPDEKMQHMVPEVTTTLIVSKIDFDCFVDLAGHREDFAEVSGDGENHEVEHVDTTVMQETLF